MNEGQLTRRQVLGVLGAGSVALAAGMPSQVLAAGSGLRSNARNTGLYDDGSDEIPGGIKGDPSRVIIVGAGFAGLAAANALRNAGVDCVVLEGRNRIGGRIHTQKVGGVPVDLGASWIHEPINNPMSAFAEQSGLSLLPASPELDAGTILLYDERTGQVPEGDKINAYLGALEFDDASRAIGAELGPDATTLEGVTRFLDQQGLSGDARRWTAFMIRLYAQLESAKDWGAQPLGRRGTATIAPPKQNHPPYDGVGLGDFPKGGYRRLANSMAGTLDVQLGHKVVEVSHDKSGVRVTVETRKKGQLRRRVVTGSHVLVTIPLGVLKAGAIEFTPRLPAAKRGAIRRIGFGNFEKVALTFEEPFWQKDERTHLLHIGENNSGSFPMFLDLQRFAEQPTLVALNAGSFARRLDSRNSGQARTNALKVLKEVYGSSIPKPVDVAVTDWLADPFSQGSYSATVFKTKPDDRALLAAPVGGRVLFAGEATNVAGRASTTDGAMSSGIREAKRILRQSKVTLASGG